MITVAVVDDHPLIHGGVREWCRDSEPPIEITTTWESPGAFLAADPRPEADAVTLDLQFGNAAPDVVSLREICKRGYRVVVLSHYTEPDLVLDCLDRGVASYLSKGEKPANVVAALHAAAADRPYHSTTMAKAMHLGRSANRPRLSGMELKVLLHWFQTESKALVAKQLHITVGTIDTYLARIRTKYAAVGRPAPSKAALVARAIQDELVTADEL
ncbi:response regulator [Allokutzneria sp. NRRL B-24872]|uniref:DNA-binding response regulator n=1 Tax=Allokutzneria sp. NRRL B-24872 TaxID=1137961 RepID=UPI000A3652A2|nr:response regulator [Allokutzneria sp. NRRL B-24872]